MSTTQCINSNGFIFSKAKVKVYNNYKKKAYNKCGCKKCIKYIKNKQMCVMTLCKSNFVSSSLSVSLSTEGAWEDFKFYLPNYIYGHFIISLAKNNIFQSMFSQLVRIKTSPCNQKIYLFFRFNFIPNPNCTYETDFLISGPIPTTSGINNNTVDPNAPVLPCIQYNNYAKLCNNMYYNLRFYCDDDYVFTPNFANLPVYNCNC